MSIIQTKRTTIRPLHLNDYPDVLEMYSEKDSFKYIKPLRDLSSEEHSQFIDKKMLQNTDEIGFWSVFTKDDNEFIGTVNLNEFANTGMIQIGCHLKRAFWNKGFGLELMTEIVNYGFETRKLDQIHGVYEDGHFVSTKLLEQLGFKFLETQTFGTTNVNIMIRYA